MVKRMVLLVAAIFALVALFMPTLTGRVQVWKKVEGMGGFSTVENVSESALSLLTGGYDFDVERAEEFESKGEVTFLGASIVIPALLLVVLAGFVFMRGLNRPFAGAALLVGLLGLILPMMATMDKLTPGSSGGIQVGTSLGGGRAIGCMLIGAIVAVIIGIVGLVKPDAPQSASTDPDAGTDD